MDLKGKKIILCSGSPRRRELLQGMRVDFTLDTDTSFQEHFAMNEPEPQKVPSLLAEGKSLGFHRPLEKDEILITSDTLVICDGKILGKPSGKEGAAAMLRTLSGKTHLVVTAVCLRSADRMKTCSDTARVTFKDLTEDEIEYYLTNYSPYDKAGSYGVQEWIGYIGIDRIDGSFYNVMGLPTSLVYEMLLEFIQY